MSEEKQTSDSKILEYNLFASIVGNYQGFPVQFCLKEFLGWDDSKIKTFLKEHKKSKKAKDKEYFRSARLCTPSTECCGSSSETQG
jgi:hypothetical protein